MVQGGYVDVFWYRKLNAIRVTERIISRQKHVMKKVVSEMPQLIVKAHPLPDQELFDGFVQLGWEWREAENFGEKFKKDVWSFFLKSLVQSFWRPMRKSMAEQGCHLQEAGKRAGINRSTLSRWSKEEHTPEFYNVCLIFARNDLDLNKVQFPVGHEAFREALFKTLKLIAAKIQKSPQTRQNTPELFTAEHWECLWHILQSQPILNALRGNSTDESSHLNAFQETLGKEFTKITEKLSVRFPNGQIQTISDVKLTVSAWLIPLVLFYTVVPYEMKGEGI